MTRPAAVLPTPMALRRSAKRRLVVVPDPATFSAHPTKSRNWPGCPAQLRASLALVALGVTLMDLIVPVKTTTFSVRRVVRTSDRTCVSLVAQKRRLLAHLVKLETMSGTNVIQARICMISRQKCRSIKMCGINHSGLMSMMPALMQLTESSDLSKTPLTVLTGPSISTRSSSGRPRTSSAKTSVESL